MIGEAVFSKLKLITVEPILFFYMLIIFLETNAITNLIYVKSCINYYKSLNTSIPLELNNCSFHKKEQFADEIIDDSTYWVRFNASILFFFTFSSGLYVASWSDKFGRKFSMIIPPLGTIIAASINCVLSVYIESSVIFLFISSIISGISFGVVGLSSAIYGFISDISSESSRTKRMMILEAVFSSGSTLGIYIAGEFLKNADYDFKFNGFARLFCFELSISALITIYTVFRIPHVSNENESDPITCGNLFKLSHMEQAIKAIFQQRIGGRRKTVLLLLLVIFLISSGLTVQITLAYLFLIKVDGNYWDFHKYSIFNAAEFAVEGTALVLGLPIFLHYLHLPDHFIAALGIISKMSGFLVFGLSKNSTMVYVCIALFTFSNYPLPAIRSILSKTVDADEKGKIFAFTTLVPNLCMLIGSLTLTSIFESTSKFFPGFCFEFVAGLQFISLCIVIYLYFTREEIVTTYVIMENEDGTVDEACISSTGSIND